MFGGMISLQLKGGLGAAITLAEKIKIFHYATSLGHAHSLLFYYPSDIFIDPVTYLTGEQKASIKDWMGKGIVRVSVGLENPDDLISDLDQALKSQSVKGAVGSIAYQAFKRLLTN
jgi:cystathionine beta-lyase/cystathionine gamma-synthase